MISAVIITKNEESNIVDCVETIDFCNEIVVIDDNSDDRTVEIAKKLGAKVFKRSLNGDFSAQRNFALSKVKNEWVIFIDADERVPKELQKEILDTILTENSIKGLYLKRYDYLWGQRLSHGEIGSLTFLRVIKKTAGKWKGSVHEVLETKGSTKLLKNALLHFPHPSITEFLEAINIYSSIRAKELFQQKKKVSYLEIFTYPTLKFLQNYVLRMGLLDSMPGLIVAIMMSLHSFLVRGKLWTLWQEK